MEEIFGDLERLAADLLPYRWPIAVAFLAALAGGLDAGKLKGNRGNQSYPAQGADLDVDSVKSVVIYCRPFHVVFSVATLEDTG
ncbi:MAG: DM13 domain-containing protein [Chloroflexi bacterium]|nr:DM13 domain-containing protein [Chloroflexota bacterium]